MLFDRSRVFTSLNADELKAGDKVIVADCMALLQEFVRNGEDIVVIREICSEENEERFFIENDTMYALAYLVERKENCTTCDCCVCAERNWATDLGNERIYCCPRYKPKTEKKYRPFKDVDELIGVWQEKCPSHNNREKALTMPLIWVRHKINFSGLKGEFITRFEDSYVDVNGRTTPLHCLFTEYEFLDGSICGVEE